MLRLPHLHIHAPRMPRTATGASCSASLVRGLEERVAGKGLKLQPEHFRQGEYGLVPPQLEMGRGCESSGA